MVFQPGHDNGVLKYYPQMAWYHNVYKYNVISVFKVLLSKTGILDQTNNKLGNYHWLVDGFIWSIESTIFWMIGSRMRFIFISVS